MATLTISRQTGSGGDQIARRVCELLGYDYLDKELMRQVAADVGLSGDEVIDFSEQNYKIRNFMDYLLRPGPRYVGQVVTRGTDELGRETLSMKELNEVECIQLIRHTLRAACQRGNMVIVGRGGQAILQTMPHVLHVRIEAPLNDRIYRLQEERMVSWEEARRLVEENDRASAQYLERFFGVRWDDPLLYHLVLNTGKWELEAAAQLLAEALRRV